MSIPRYAITQSHAAQEDPRGGGWVLHSDHVAEVERLTEAARLAEMQSDQAVSVAHEGIAEVERLTALLKESDDERVSLKTHYPRLRADLAAARAQADGLAAEARKLIALTGTTTHRLTTALAALPTPSVFAPDPADLRTVLDHLPSVTLMADVLEAGDRLRAALPTVPNGGTE